MKTVAMYVRVAADLHRAVKARAAAEDRSMAWIVRDALTRYLEDK